jgi:hypothetical protein
MYIYCVIYLPGLLLFFNLLLAYYNDCEIKLEGWEISFRIPTTQGKQEK